MKNYNPIADGAYVRECVGILKDFGTYAKMDKEEKAFFKPCRKCTSYDKYAANKEATACPCQTCEHRKTETQVGNKMTTLRKKYLEEDY